MEKRNTIRIPVAVRILLLIAYLVILAYCLFFAEAFGRNSGQERFSINLVPFHEIMRAFSYQYALPPGFIFVNIFGNILAFIPFGFLVTSLFKTLKIRTGVIVILLSALFSALVELLQFVTRTGSLDIDDLILNTLGGAIGFIIYCIIFMRAPKNSKNNNRSRKGRQK